MSIGVEEEMGLEITLSQKDGVPLNVGWNGDAIKQLTS
jgi:hypothetical protein